MEENLAHPVQLTVKVDDIDLLLEGAEFHNNLQGKAFKHMGKCNIVLAYLHQDDDFFFVQSFDGVGRSLQCRWERLESFC